MNQELTFTRGQIIYKQGNPAKGIWLISNGEFEIMKTFQDKNNSLQKSNIRIIVPLHEKPIKIKNAKMTITGIYDILGLEDLFSKKETWQTSVVCLSQTAQAFFIKRDDFYHLQSVDCFDENMLQHLTLANEFKKSRINHMKRVIKSVRNSANISPKRD